MMPQLRAFCARGIPTVALLLPSSSVPGELDVAPPPLKIHRRRRRTGVWGRRPSPPRCGSPPPPYGAAAPAQGDVNGGEPNLEGNAGAPNVGHGEVNGGPANLNANAEPVEPEEAGIHGEVDNGNGPPCTRCWWTMECISTLKCPRPSSGTSLRMWFSTSGMGLCLLMVVFGRGMDWFVSLRRDGGQRCNCLGYRIKW